MLALITFVVGIVIFLRGEFRLSDRTVLRPQARSIGLILMAPLVIQFCVSFFLVNNYVQFNEDGSFTFTPDFDSITGTLGMVELVAVIIAIGLALFTIFSKPPAEAVSSLAQTRTGVKPQQQVPDIMTVAEAAAYMRVSESDVLELIEQGRLGAARIGSTYRIARIAIDDFMGRT